MGGGLLDEVMSPHFHLANCFLQVFKNSKIFTYHNEQVDPCERNCKHLSERLSWGSREHL